MQAKSVGLSARLAAWKAETPVHRERLVEEIRSAAKSSGASKVVLGVSGGLDSATAAALCAQALGAQNVFALVMPHRATNPASLSLAQGVVNALGITGRRVNLSPLLDSYFSNYPDASKQRRGLGAGWMRTGVLVDLGSHYGAIAVQAMNRTDRALRYGEAQHAIETALKPLVSLWKSQVRLLAEELGVLPEIRTRRPSLEYWAGQSDEADLGWPYDELDPVLDGLVEGTASAEELRARTSSPEIMAWASAALETGVKLGAPGPSISGRTG